MTVKPKSVLVLEREKRRAAVEQLLIRGVGQEAILATLARTIDDDKPSKRIYNKDTGEAWSLGTINADCQLIEKRWREKLGGDMADFKAETLQEISEAKKIAFAKKDSRAILLAGKARRELLGLDMPKKTDIKVEGIKGYAVISPDDWDNDDSK